MGKLFRIIKLSKDIVGVLFVLYLTVLSLIWCSTQIWDARGAIYKVTGDYIELNQKSWKKVDFEFVNRFKPHLWNLPKDGSEIHCTVDGTTVVRQYTRHPWFRWKKSLGKIVR